MAGFKKTKKLSADAPFAGETQAIILGEEGIPNN